MPVKKVPCPIHKVQDQGLRSSRKAQSRIWWDEHFRGAGVTQILNFMDGH